VIVYGKTYFKYRKESLHSNNFSLIEIVLAVLNAVFHLDDSCCNLMQFSVLISKKNKTKLNMRRL